MSWRDVVLDVMKVPAAPAPPPGSEPRVFRAAPQYFTLRLILFVIAQLFVLAMTLALLFMLGNAPQPSPVARVLRIIETIALAGLGFQFFYGLAVLRLSYELRWYMVSDRAIRIREGIGIVREKTITFANIQNIEVKQGPLQRILGISDVEVKTAGGGGMTAHQGKKSAGEPMHVAYFRGVDNAAEIRDVLREGVRRQRGAGLGDPDDHHGPSSLGPRPSLDEAAAELLREARALREAVAGPKSLIRE